MFTRIRTAKRVRYTNKCKGYAFIQYKKSTDAKEAISAMHDFELAGEKLSVGYAQTGPRVVPRKIMNFYQTNMRNHEFS